MIRVVLHSHVTDQRCEGKPARCRGTGKSNSLGEIGSSRDAVTYRPSGPATSKRHPRALVSIGQMPRSCEILEQNGKVGRTSIRKISSAQTLDSTLSRYDLGLDDIRIDVRDMLSWTSGHRVLYWFMPESRTFRILSICGESPTGGTHCVLLISTLICCVCGPRMMG